MRAKRSLNSFIASFERLRRVRNPIASEVWMFKDRKGRERRVEIAVGSPQPIPGHKSGDWFCAVYISDWTPHVVPALGIGPLDSLSNALTLVKSFREHVADMHINSDTPSRR